MGWRVPGRILMMGTKTTRTGVELIGPADASMREWAETFVARSRAEGLISSALPGS